MLLGGASGLALSGEAVATCTARIGPVSAAGDAMISDDDVCNFYHYLDLPGVYGNDPLTLQIFRGLSTYQRDGYPDRCQRHMEVFRKYRIIAEYCFGCYKVLAEPRTVMEHFKLLMVFQEIELPNDNLRKCMTEVRPDCGGAYKGFIYCRGMDEGMEVRDLVAAAVAREISPEVPVQLKRGCSEYAAAFPEYTRLDPGVEPMTYNERWRIHEEEFDRNVAYSPPGPRSHDGDEDPAYTPAEIFAMTYWLYYAATIGDDSYRSIAGGTLPPLPELKRPPFVPPPGPGAGSPAGAQ